MTTLEAVLAISNGVLAFLLGLLLKRYLLAYAKSKAKNLATKEDIAEITQKVEKVRAAVTNETALLEKRRQVYENIADALRVFIHGHGATSKQQEAFHAAYAACWLWAPDDLLTKLNDFIDIQKDLAMDRNSHPQDKIRSSYGQVILEMRRDVGFPSTKLDEKAYEFVSF